MAVEESDGEGKGLVKNKREERRGRKIGVSLRLLLLVLPPFTMKP